jgi:hypothetical protein
MESAITAVSRTRSTTVAIIQKGTYFKVRDNYNCNTTFGFTSGIHLPVHTIHGVGNSHWKTIPAKTAIVHTNTNTLIARTPALRKVLSAR